MKSKQTRAMVAGLLTVILLGTSWLNAAGEAPGIKLQVQDDQIQIVTDADAPSYYLEYRTPAGTWQPWNAGQNLDNAEALWFRAVFESGDIMLYEPPADVDTFYSPAISADGTTDGQSTTKVGSLSTDGSVTAVADRDLMSEQVYTPPAALADIPPTPANNQAYATPDPGKTALYWHNQNSGQVVWWNLNDDGTRKSSAVASETTISSSWRLAGVGDIDRDETHDLIWHNQSSGQVVYWLMHPDGLRKSGGLVSDSTISSAWRLGAAVDVDDDGTTDLIWHNQSSGGVVYWRLNEDGTRKDGGYVSSNTISSAWTLAGAGIVDPAGNKVAIFWHNQSSGSVVYWMIGPDGKRTDGGYVSDGTISAAWKLGAVVDINNDGAVDFIWHNQSTGRVVYWLLNSVAQRTGGGYVSDITINSAWTLGGARDIDGNGNVVTLWHNQSSGSVAYWMLNEIGVRESGGLVSDSTINSSWKLSGLGE